MTIQDPGKFEGEPDWAPEIYDIILNGFQDETLHCGDDETYDIIILSPDIKIKYPELVDVYGVVLYEDTQGFVHTQTYTETELDMFRNELEECNGPNEGDIVTEDYRKWYQNGKLILELDAEDDHVKAILEHMEADKYWPNVWAISDHGNCQILSLIPE